MIIFISGPITGHSDYKEKFKAAEDQLRAAGYDFISPRALADLVSDPELLSRDAYMEYGYARAMDKLILEYASMVWPEVKDEDRNDKN